MRSCLPLIQWHLAGCILAQQGDSGVEFQKFDGHKVKIVDSVGCGDSFAAAVRLLTVSSLIQDGVAFAHM